MKLWTRVVSCRNAVWEMAPDVDGMVRAREIDREGRACGQARRAHASVTRQVYLLVLRIRVSPDLR